jgi:hypothetical protein
LNFFHDYFILFEALGKPWSVEFVLNMPFLFNIDLQNVLKVVEAIEGETQMPLN